MLTAGRPKNHVRRTFLAVLLVLLGTPGVVASAPQRENAQTVAGVAVDSSGAVLPGAQVVLTTGLTTAVQTTVADATGMFRFASVPPGRYEVKVSFEGFQTTTVKVIVDRRAPSPLRVVLPLAKVTQNVTVSNHAIEVGTGAAANSDAVTVDQSTLASLPVFDQDYVATLSRFLDAGSIGTGGVTVVVNGMEVSALRVSASAVQQIKINQDPYSAEYARPGRGRIEILTKPGSQEYHGEGNVIFRDARLNARNAFAPTKPPEQRRILEGTFGGPLGHGGQTSFLLSGHDQMEDQQAVVFAIGPSGAIRDVVPAPNRESLLAFSVTRQIGNRVTISIRPNYEYESTRNRGVGGTTLATAGTDFEHKEQQVTYTQQTMIRPTLLHQLQILVGHEREPVTSVSPAPGIVVAGAFTGGGGQGDLLRTELHTQLTTSLAWTKSRHLVQAGFQLPDWSRRGFYDRTNFGGTFFFASLDAVRGGHALRLYRAAGQRRPCVCREAGRRVYQGRLAGPDRYDRLARPAVRLAELFPRHQQLRTARLARLRTGRQQDERGPGRRRHLQRSQRSGGDRRSAARSAWRSVRYVITNPSYPDPFQSAAAATEPPSVVRLAPGVQIPQSLQYSVGIDHQ